MNSRICVLSSLFFTVALLNASEPSEQEASQQEARQKELRKRVNPDISVSRNNSLNEGRILVWEWRAPVKSDIVVPKAPAKGIPAKSVKQMIAELEVKTKK